MSYLSVELWAWYGCGKINQSMHIASPPIQLNSQYNVKPRRISYGLKNRVQKEHKRNPKYCSHYLGRLWWTLLSFECNWYNPIFVSAASQRPYIPGWPVICCLGDWHQCNLQSQDLDWGNGNLNHWDRCLALQLGDISRKYQLNLCPPLGRSFISIMLTSAQQIFSSWMMGPSRQSWIGNQLGFTPSSGFLLSRIEVEDSTWMFKMIPALSGRTFSNHISLMWAFLLITTMLNGRKVWILLSLNLASLTMIWTSCKARHSITAQNYSFQMWLHESLPACIILPFSS